jgi:hypothetical protein
MQRPSSFITDPKTGAGRPNPERLRFDQAERDALVESWMEGGPEDDMPARRYLSDETDLIKVGDYPTLAKHARVLQQMGMPLVWVQERLWFACRIWCDDRFEPTIRNVIAKAYAKAELLNVPPDDGPNRFEGKSLDHFDTLPPVKWLWEGVIAEKSLFVVYGREKTGKTFLTLNLALNVATAQHPRQFCDLNVTWQTVLYIIAEGNEAEFGNRLRVWIEANSRPGKDRENLRELVRCNFRAVTVPVMINTPEQVAALLKANEKKWGLVVIDTYMRNTSGNVNDPQDSAAFVRGCDTIRETTGGVVIVVHHQGKDETRGAFGSMHLTGACDGAAVVTRKGEERIFRTMLMRNGDDGQEDIVYKLRRSLVHMTEEGDEQFSCYVDFVERRKRGSSGSAEISEQDAEAETALRIYTDKPASVRDLATLLNVPKTTVHRRLGEMREKGLIGDGLKLTKAGVELAKQNDDEEGF